MNHPPEDEKYVVQLVPMSVQMSYDRLGNCKIELQLAIQLVLVQEIDPARAMRRRVLASHFQGITPLN